MNTGDKDNILAQSKHTMGNTAGAAGNHADGRTELLVLSKPTSCSGQRVLLHLSNV